MGINICVCVRTRDEEKRIAQFCESYKDADIILVADGGSVDRTKEIASQYSNVVVGDYPGRIPMQNGYWRNNDSDHANWLFRWAYSLHPDWIIYDDCDCRPNTYLREDYRDIFSGTGNDVVMAVRMYLWGGDKHFPHMSKPGTSHADFETSLWAWRGGVDLWTVNAPPAYTFKIGNKDIKDFRNDAKTLELFPPYCLIHYSWDDPERVKEKIKIYRDSGLIPNMQHPLDFAGPPEDLPEWVRE